MWSRKFVPFWSTCIHPAICVCFIDRCLSFCSFSVGHCVVCPTSFGHCVVCPTSIYGFNYSFGIFILSSSKGSMMLSCVAFTMMIISLILNACNGCPLNCVCTEQPDDNVTDCTDVKLTNIPADIPAETDKL